MLAKTLEGANFVLYDNTAEQERMEQFVLERVITDMLLPGICPPDAEMQAAYAARRDRQG